MAKVIGLEPIAQAAEDIGFHQASKQKMNMHLKDDTANGGAYQAPLIIGGTVSAAPLTMANVYATIAAKGVECTPIAIKKVTDATGAELDVPKANCHQAVDPDIAETVAYAMNQGVVRPNGQARTAQLANNRKTFAKTGTNENTYMLTGGFVPQIAAFVAVGNADGNSDFDNKIINGVYHRTWFGSYIATPTWKNFMDTYLTSFCSRRQASTPRLLIRPRNRQGRVPARQTGRPAEPAERAIPAASTRRRRTTRPPAAIRPRADKPPAGSDGRWFGS